MKGEKGLPKGANMSTQIEASTQEAQAPTSEAQSMTAMDPSNHLEQSTADVGKTKPDLCPGSESGTLVDSSNVPTTATTPVATSPSNSLTSLPTDDAAVGSETITESTSGNQANSQDTGLESQCPQELKVQPREQPKAQNAPDALAAFPEADQTSNMADQNPATSDPSAPPSVGLGSELKGASFVGENLSEGKAKTMDGGNSQRPSRTQGRRQSSLPHEIAHKGASFLHQFLNSEGWLLLQYAEMRSLAFLAAGLAMCGMGWLVIGISFRFTLLHAIAIGIGARLIATRGFGHPIWMEDVSLHGKTVLITGGSQGIGYEVVWRTLAYGASKVIVGLRNCSERQEALRAKMVMQALSSGSKGVNTDALEFIELDLLSPPSCLAFTDKVARTLRKTGEKSASKSADATAEPSVDAAAKPVTIDVVILNAGIFHVPKVETDAKTKAASTDKFGVCDTVAVNSLSQMLIMRKLATAKHLSANARIVFTSSLAHHLVTKKLDFDFLQNIEESSKMEHAVEVYAMSKLMNIYAATFYGIYLSGGSKSCSLHPGSILTDISLPYHDAITSWMHWAISVFVRLVLRVGGQTPSMGAQTVLAAAYAKDVENMAYYQHATLARPSNLAADPAETIRVIDGLHRMLDAWL